MNKFSHLKIPSLSVSHSVEDWKICIPCSQRYVLLQQIPQILQGKINSRRGPGRRRISWLANLRRWFDMSSAELFRTAINKIRIVMMITNIRNG
ncbi:hypothetical protein M8J77_024749 [Diaphorina citri]|nr:hypothetical protein M8J77_024749 [Diaphorina citri]